MATFSAHPSSHFTASFSLKCAQFHLPTVCLFLNLIFENFTLEPLVKLYEMQAASALYFSACDQPQRARRCFRSEPQRTFPSAIFCQSSSQNPSWDHLWCNPGATSALNCQISLEKDSALSQESILMLTVPVVLCLAAGDPLRVLRGFVNPLEKLEKKGF